MVTSTKAVDIEAIIRTFADARPYTQDEPGEARFALLLAKDEVPGLQIGLVELVGPIHKTPAAHDAWEQIYLILEGSGTIHLPGRADHIEGATMVVIPKNTMHSVELRAGERIRYVYINQYR